MDVPPQRSPDAGWMREILTRILMWWPAKMFGTTLGMTAFFLAYFWLLRHPLRAPAIMPLTVVDDLIGFWPAALPLYLSLWFYVSLAPALLKDRRELFSYGLATIALSVLGLGIFLLWPTAVPVREVDWSLHPQLGFLKSADASGNACPSLHVAFAVFTAVWFARILRQMGAVRLFQVLNGLWCGAILYSTMAIRQHVFLDVLAGAALGWVVVALHLRVLRAFPVQPGLPQSEAANL